MSLDAERTLLLSQGYEPLRVITWQRAVTLLFLGKVEVVETYASGLRSATRIMPKPAVVRLMRAVRRHVLAVKFTREHLYARDKYCCQYCGKPGAVGPRRSSRGDGDSDLTYDHVIPKAQGGTTGWTNIVTACRVCNRKKGGRTPREAGMTLLATPVQPTWLPAVAIRLSLRRVPEPWRAYLGGNAEEE